MAGMTALLDLMRRNRIHGSCTSAKSLQSFGLLSATVAASAAAGAGAGRHFAPRGLLSNVGITVTFCDAGAELSGDYFPITENTYAKVSSSKRSSEDSFWHTSISSSTKEYPIELKPLFSAFGPKAFAMTSVRSILLFYLPLLEPRPSTEDDDVLQDSSEEETVDLVIPFKKSLKQIARETTVVTTRRVLERLAVCYVSRRMAWKLIKDVPRSASRKAARRMPTAIFVYSVSKTTFRGQMLAVAASWIVQVGIDIYRCFFHRSEDVLEEPTAKGKLRHLGKRVYAATVKCSASLVFASLGAGICASFHPSIGQWAGCALGDVGGPIFVSLYCERFLHLEG